MASGCLCDNLIYEILLFLPVKDLIRYTSVCKSWYNTIHSSSFINNHTSINQSRTDDNSPRSLLILPIPFTDCILYSGKTCDTRSTLALPCKPSTYVRYSGSCSGLICLADYKSMYNPDICIYIWNPSIRKLKLLPRRSYRPSSNDIINFGIGINSLCNDCHVVKLTYYGSNRLPTLGPTAAEVYSLSTNSWKMVSLNYPIIETRKRSASVNGYIYWLGESVGKILSFNTANNSFEEIKHPIGSGWCPRYHISVVKERIHLWMADEHEIWMMREHGVYESWTKLYKIQQIERFSATYQLTVKGEFLEFKENICVNLSLYDHEKLSSYDLYGGHILFAASYVESLVMLDTTREIDQSLIKKRKLIH